MEHSSERLKNLYRIRSQKNVSTCITDWSIIFIAFLFSANFTSPFMLLMAFFTIARCQHSLMLEGHESIHGLVFKNRFWNDMWGKLICFGPVGIGFNRAKISHFEHHRALSTTADEEIDLHALVPLTKLTIIKHFLGALFGAVLLKKIISKKHTSHYIPQKEPSKNAKLDDLTATLLCQICLFLFFHRILPWSYFYLWALPLVTLTAFIHHLKAFCDHAKLPTEDQGSGLYNYVPDAWDGLFIGLQQTKHGTHHIYPQIPYYNLRHVNCDKLKEKPSERVGYFRTLLLFYFVSESAENVRRYIK